MARCAKLRRLCYFQDLFAAPKVLKSLDFTSEAAQTRAHLVTLLVLRPLPLQVLLGDRHAALRALLRARLFHPLLEELIGLTSASVHTSLT